MASTTPPPLQHRFSSSRPPSRRPSITTAASLYRASPRRGSVVSKSEAGASVAPVSDASATTLGTFATERDLFDPYAHRTSAAFVSDCTAWTHVLNGLLCLWMLLHACLFAAIGLVGAIILVIYFAIMASYALHMMLRNELAICCEEQVPWLGLPRSLEFACKGGPRSLRRIAVCLRNTAYVLYVILGITIITSYVIITSLLLGHLWEEYSTGVDSRVYVVPVIPALLLLCLVPNLRYLMPVSLMAIVVVAVGCVLLVVDILLRPTPPDAPPSPPLAPRHDVGALFFIAAEMLALSFIIVVVVVEKHMDNPQNMLGCKGCLNWCLVLSVAMQILVSTTIYVKFDADLSYYFLANLSRSILLDVVKFLFMFGALLAVPIYVFALQDIIWDMKQQCLQKYSESKRKTCEFGLRVLIVIICILLALVFPTYGKENCIPVALTVPLLLWGFPALIEVTLCWQVQDFGPCKYILWKDLIMILLPVFFLACAICYQVIG